MNNPNTVKLNCKVAHSDYVEIGFFNNELNIVIHDSTSISNSLNLNGPIKLEFKNNDNIQKIFEFFEKYVVKWQPGGELTIKYPHSNKSFKINTAYTHQSKKRIIFGYGLLGSEDIVSTLDIEKLRNWINSLHIDNSISQKRLF